MEPKPVICLSRCLGFENCRYNGDIIRDAFIEKLKSFIDAVTVCPEVEAGLGVPRAPIRIVQHGGRRMLYQPAADRDVTGAMNKAIEAAIISLKNKDIDGFILKSRSPSCGFKDVKEYKSDGKDPAAVTGTAGKGPGFFGASVLDIFGDSGSAGEGFSGLPIEDEGRLLNFSIRDHFLIRIFTLARFRLVKKTDTIKALIDFHTNNKLLFLALNEKGMRELGRITAGYNKRRHQETIGDYDNELKKILAKPPSYKAMINALQHAFGHVSRELMPREREFFLNLVEEYRDERIPLSVPVKLIASYAVRFNTEYLLRQTILAPYPPAITDITDSGKGRDF